MAGYRLGVDLGTTWTAAAVERDGLATVVALSQRSQAIPTVVHLGADGTVLVGDAAVRRGLDEPERVAREMKRRIGDSAPILLGGSPWSPELLQARVLRWVVDHVTAEQGEPPEVVTVTHPANWGAFKVDLLFQAIRQVGLTGVRPLPEPVAAASWYASQHRIAEGDAIAVYDLGGGTFDTAVVRRSATGFEVLGRPDGVERLGGIDFDAAVLAHVVRQVAEAWDALDPSDPEVVADAAALRDRCVEAKEALSADTAVAIPVRLPAVRTTVRLTRDELEQMVRGPLGETITALRRTIDSAGLTPAELAAVLLVGGSSRMPLVGELVSAGIGVPVAVDANPKYAVAMGAALPPAPAADAPRDAPGPVTPAPVATAVPAAPPEQQSPSATALEPAGSPAGGRKSRRWWAAGAVLAVAAVVAASVSLPGDDGEGDGEGDGGDEVTSEGSPQEDDGDVPVGDGVLRIGLLAPADGTDPSFATAAMLAAAELAVADLNDADGVLGSPVELVVQRVATVEEVQDATDRLAEGGVDVVVGPVEADAVEVVRDHIADLGLAACSAHDVAVDSLYDDGGWYVRTIPDEDLGAAALVEAVIADGHTTVAIAAPDDVPDYLDALESRLDDAGVTVDDVSTYLRGDLDPETVGSELNNTGATGWLLIGDEALADVVAEGAGQGLIGPFYTDGALVGDAAGRRMAEAIAGGSQAVVVSPATPGVGGGATVADRVAGLLDGGPDPFPYAAPYVYDCIVLAAVAAQLAGSDHPEAIVGAVNRASRDGEPCSTVECLDLAADGVDLDYVGASGAVDLDDDGEVTTGSFDRLRREADISLTHEATLEVRR